MYTVYVRYTNGVVLFTAYSIKHLDNMLIGFRFGKVIRVSAR